MRQNTEVVMDKGDIYNGDYVAVPKYILDLIKNSLQRDLENGLLIRGEILNDLNQMVKEIPTLEEPTPIASASVYEYCQDDKGDVKGECWKTARVAFTVGFLESYSEGDNIDLYVKSRQPPLQLTNEELVDSLVTNIKDKVNAYLESIPKDKIYIPPQTHVHVCSCGIMSFTIPNQQ